MFQKGKDSGIDIGGVALLFSFLWFPQIWNSIVKTTSMDYGFPAGAFIERDVRATGSLQKFFNSRLMTFLNMICGVLWVMFLPLAQKSENLVLRHLFTCPAQRRQRNLSLDKGGWYVATVSSP